MEILIAYCKLSKTNALHFTDWGVVKDFLCHFFVFFPPTSTRLDEQLPSKNPRTHPAPALNKVATTHIVFASPEWEGLSVCSRAPEWGLKQHCLRLTKVFSSALAVSG